MEEPNSHLTREVAMEHVYGITIISLLILAMSTLGRLVGRQH
ncbi:MAG TPA: hypothetical protein VF507_00645 [Pyrinomonadaceae bacterium]